MTNLDILSAAARLLAEFGDVQSAERAAGARVQTACNTSERGYWDAVRRVLTAQEPPVSGRNER
jgi:hypothetical protein